MEDWIKNTAEILVKGKPVQPVPNGHSKISVKQAYQIQKQLFQATKYEVFGYKAALTSHAVQKYFSIDSPISGVLIAGNAVTENSEFNETPGVKLETELGFRLGRDLEGKVTENTVLNAVDSIVPVIEIARPYFTESPRGIDLIASNSASYRYIVSSHLIPKNSSIDNIQVEFFRDDLALHSAKAGSVLEGQRQALCWLINHLFEIGQPLLKGQLLITGSIGDLHDGIPGRYFARFGRYGDLHFTIS